MAVDRPIDITTDQRKTLLALIKRHLPNTTAWAYGSRVKWTARPQSDLDLVVFTKPEQERNVSELREAFEESNLPFRVDLFVWDAIPEQFRKQIESDHLVLVEKKEQYIPSGWHVMTFADAPIEIIDGDRGKNYPKQDEFFKHGYCMFLNAGNVTSNGFDFSLCMFIAAEKDRHMRKGKLTRGDVVLTTRGTVGNSAYFDQAVPYNHIRINSGMVILRAKDHALNSLYLYFFIRSKQFLSQITALRTGSAQPQLPIRDINKVEIPLPPLPEQRAIAHVLGTLDDKIELNRRMNETLEAMARALFKSWFIDFDPVRAKMAGRDPGLPQHLADLFPDRLVDSELGPIPEGWAVKRLADEIAALFSGNRPKGGATDAGIPSIGAENVDGLGRHDFSKEKYVPEDFFNGMKAKGSVVQNGDVLLYKDGAHIGRKTYLDRDFPYRECTVNEHVFILRLRNKKAQRCLFFWLDQGWMTQEIVGLNSNSAQPGINKVGVLGLPFLAPPCEVMSEFDRQMGHFTDRIFTNCHESRTLTTLRDGLLPKLISGGVCIHKAEIQMETIV